MDLLNAAFVTFVAYILLAIVVSFAIEGAAPTAPPVSPEAQRARARWSAMFVPCLISAGCFVAAAITATAAPPDIPTISGYAFAGAGAAALARYTWRIGSAREAEASS